MESFTKSIMALNEPKEIKITKKTPLKLTNLVKRPPVDIEFRKLYFAVKVGRPRKFNTILKGVNGKVSSGEITAIMGPSGAGKSTLMNILAGYKTSHLSGTVTVNGRPRNLRQFRKLSCYIMQDDMLLPFLTVKEAMNVSANLKLGKEIHSSTKKIIIEEILDALGLLECVNTKTVNLSGGQRKRLSIALELVNNPPVMFFDEPTTGLDSSSCFQLISVLRHLARDGRTIVCTIHQPSARLFDLFDKLYMLAEGMCLYQGPISGLIPFLTSNGYACPSYHNPADYVMEIASGDHGEAYFRLVTAMEIRRSMMVDQPSSIVILSNEDETKESSQKSKSEKSKKDTFKLVIEIPKDVEDKEQMPSTSVSLSDIFAKRQRKHRFPTSPWVQFWVLLKRTFLSMIRDQTLTHLRIMSHFVVGGLIGMIYFGIGNDGDKIHSNMACIFFIILFTMFTSMMPTLLTFPVEMGVFIREHLNHWYSLKAYYFAKMAADFPFQVLFTSVYTIAVYLLTKQPLESWRLGMFVLICTLTSLVSQSIGLVIGAGFSIETGSFLGPITTIPTILFSGFFINLTIIPKYLYWLTYISYIRYGFEGAMMCIYGYHREDFHCSSKFCHTPHPDLVLTEFGMHDSNYWVDVGALLTFFVTLRILGYFVLRWKIYSLR